MTTDSHGKITDEKLEKLRKHLGEAQPDLQAFVSEASIDTIRHWADGIGTDNPLYTDESYAEEGPYGELVAPPTFLFAASRYTSGFVRGLKGVHTLYGGTEWTWHQPIRRGMRIRTETTLSDVTEQDSSFSGTAVQQTYTTEFETDDGRPIATADSWTFRVEREQATENEKYSDEGGSRTADWDESDIQRFAEHYRNEEPRGDNPRYIEDVAEGDELDTLLKGPTSVTGGITFLQGWGGAYIQANRNLFELFDEYPSLRETNRYGAPESSVQVHWSEEAARRNGLPAPYDFGPARVAWLGHVCHHWMSDYGFLKRLRVEVRQPNLMGDIQWCRGTVTEVRDTEETSAVDVSLSAENQHEETTAKGSATIALPSRDDESLLAVDS
jgi:acyl dehydratase